MKRLTKYLSVPRLMAIALCGMLTITCSSCAYVISGSKQKVTFTSNATNATVYMNYDSIGTTNEAIKLPRHNLDNIYTISADECIDTSFTLVQKFNAWCYLDVVNPLFLLIDFGQGVQFKTDKAVEINLNCNEKE